MDGIHDFKRNSVCPNINAAMNGRSCIAETKFKMVGDTSEADSEQATAIVSGE